MVPNMATPARKAKALPTLKIRLRNSRRGMIGSTARRSIQTNAAASATAPPSRTMATPSVQPYWLPRQSRYSSRQVTAPTMVAAPR